MIPIDPSSKFVKALNSTWQKRDHYFTIRCFYRTFTIHCKPVFRQNWKYLDSHNTVGLYRVIQPFPILEGLAHPKNLVYVPWISDPAGLIYRLHLTCASVPNWRALWIDTETLNRQNSSLGQTEICRAALDVKWMKTLANEIEMLWKLWKLFFIIFNYLYLHQLVDTFGFYNPIFLKGRF